MKKPEVATRAHATRKRHFEEGLWSPHILTQEERENNRQYMLQNNPMKNPEAAKRCGATQRASHQQNPFLWKEKYRAAKFSHWVKVAKGEEVLGPQRCGANNTAVAFFELMRNTFNWEADDDFFDLHPYEFPIIISEAHKICFFPDYYNRSKNLIIEWDEKLHQTPARKTKDKRRDSLIRSIHPTIRIIRLVEQSFLENEERLKYIEKELSNG